jgi:hypothetical protein
VTDPRQPGEGLTPEQKAQVQQALAGARAALKRVSLVGILGPTVRGAFRRTFRRVFRLPRFSRGKLAGLGIGLVVVASSVVTCSVGVDPASLTAGYGEPIPATTEAAYRFAERTGNAIQRASANRRLRITVSEVEATSALSLGLLTPELMRAVQTMPPEQARQIGDIESLRTVLREGEAAARDTMSLRQKIATLFDPRLRTGDVQVRFTGRSEIVIAGYVEAWSFRQPALVVFAPRARSGELQLDFVKGKLGRLPAPEAAFDLLGKLVASLMLQGRDYAEISNLRVEQGRLSFEAVVK